MIGLLVGSLLLTPVSAGVSDNLNSALASVLSSIDSKIGEENTKTASIAANTSNLTKLDNLTSLSSIDGKLNSIDNSLNSFADSIKKLDKIDDLTKALNHIALTESMTSFDSVTFASASWGTVHDILQASSLEYCNWKIGDKKVIGEKEVAIMSLTYNTDGPDEITLAILKSVGNYGYASGLEKCENFYKEIKDYTGIDCGVRSWMPVKNEIPSDFGADVHLTNTLQSESDSLCGATSMISCDKMVGASKCERHVTYPVYFYKSNGSTVAAATHTYHTLHSGIKGVPFEQLDNYEASPICPVVTIN